MSEFILCVSQTEAQEPYKFKLTNINVYSFEEAAYHIYNYWEQSLDEFMSEEFLCWVRDSLGLSFLGSKIAEISKIRSITERNIGFLTLTDYFDDIRLSGLKAKLVGWEQRLEWEKLKERGDYLALRGNPGAAAGFYRRALQYEENSLILNNLGLSLMRLSLFEEAVENLERALKLDPENLQIILNLAEALIYRHDFEKALRLLERAEKFDKSNTDIQCLHGLLNFEADNIRYSIDYFERALERGNDPFYVYSLADVYVKLRQYDKALETLERVEKRDTEFMVKQAEIYAKYNNIPASIKAIGRALLSDRESVELWAALAMYHRLDYDLIMANNAISKALRIAPDNERARLELARIRKAQGKRADYQGALHEILSGFKRKYRDTINLQRE